LARVSGYDGLGSMMATPLGALIAGPAATHYGVRRTQFATAGLIAAVSLVALVPRDIRNRRATAPLNEDGPAAMAAAGPVR
ncbi:MAG TPA: hypothetical protein VHW06_06100, partial [Streptosporangiaceae bacterium]|nr:hypothetical protein [Streptosporangiaceae bacterium]